MTKNIAFVFLTAALTYNGYGAEYWVDGVSKESGWYDANKTPTDDGYAWVDGDKGDVGTCHLATAANLVAWWQNRYADKLNTQGVPSTAEEIWATYKENQIVDSGGFVPYSFQWWLTGVEKPANEEEAVFTKDGFSAGDVILKASDGFYRDLLLPYESGIIDAEAYYDTGISSALSSLLTSTSYGTNSFDSVSGDLLTALTGGCAVGMRLQYSGGYHALTLWGAETDESGIITKLWLTDSDDSKKTYGGITDPSLFYVYVGENENGEMEILNHGKANNYADSDRGLDTFVIRGLTIVNPSSSDNWAWQSIPEPTTGTLSLLALAGLLARRRRR